MSLVLGALVFAVPRRGQGDMPKERRRAWRMPRQTQPPVTAASERPTTGIMMRWALGFAIRYGSGVRGGRPEARFGICSRFVSDEPALHPVHQVPRRFGEDDALRGLVELPASLDAWTRPGPGPRASTRLRSWPGRRRRSVRRQPSSFPQ